MVDSVGLSGWVCGIECGQSERFCVDVGSVVGGGSEIDGDGVGGCASALFREIGFRKLVA